MTDLTPTSELITDLIAKREYVAHYAGYVPQTTIKMTQRTIRQLERELQDRGIETWESNSYLQDKLTEAREITEARTNNLRTGDLCHTCADEDPSTTACDCWMVYAEAHANDLYLD